MFHSFKSSGRQPADPSLFPGTMVPKGRRYFVSPEPRGRVITAGFTMLTHIGKPANMEVWFPEEFRVALEGKRASGFSLSSDDFPAEWAAIRQYELFQQGGNIRIYDLKVTNLWRSLKYLSKSMRSGGLTVTIASMGRYSDGKKDELAILDDVLQERLSELAHALYLEHESQATNRGLRKSLKDQTWSYINEMPTVATAIEASGLFRPERGAHSILSLDLKSRLARRFFDILQQLPKNNICHEVAMATEIPCFNSVLEGVYCAPGEDTFHEFSRAISTVMSHFDHINLSRHQGRSEFRSDVQPSMMHLKGSGFRCTDQSQEHYRRSALFARGAVPH